MRVISERVLSLSFNLWVSSRGGFEDYSRTPLPRLPGCLTCYDAWRSWFPGLSAITVAGRLTVVSVKFSPAMYTHNKFTTVNYPELLDSQRPLPLSLVSAKTPG